MGDIQQLIKTRDDLLAKIREIEQSCEGIDNENNARRIQELNFEQAQLSAKKQELSLQLSAINNRLSAIGSEIASLSGKGIEKILDAIGAQRWYFIKNKPKVIFDRDSGLLWANPEYYNIGSNDDHDQYHYTTDFSKLLENINLDDISDWHFPTKNEFILMINDDSFPFKGDYYHYISYKREDYR